MKLLKTIVLFCAVLILSPSLVFAQADVFQKGESGIGFLIGYADGDRSNTIQGTALGTISGILDFGFFTNSVSRGRSSDRTITTGYHLGIYPIRENASSKIKINLGIFAEYSNIEGENFEIVGISIFKRLGKSSSFVQPKASVIKVWPRGFSKPGEMAYQFDFTIAWKNETSIITITPSLLYGEDATVVGFTAGFAVPLKPSN